MAEMGAFAEGLAIGEEGVRIAEAAHHPFSLTSRATNRQTRTAREGRPGTLRGVGAAVLCSLTCLLVMPRRAP